MNETKTKRTSTVTCVHACTCIVCLIDKLTSLSCSKSDVLCLPFGIKGRNRNIASCKERSSSRNNVSYQPHVHTQTSIEGKTAVMNTMHMTAPTSFSTTTCGASLQDACIRNVSCVKSYASSCSSTAHIDY